MIQFGGAWSIVWGD